MLSGRRFCKIKYNFWSSIPYYFSQQFEPIKIESNAERPCMGQGNNIIYSQKFNEIHNRTGHSGIFDSDCKPRFHLMPPIGGIKQTEGNDNLTYSENTPEWKAMRNMRAVWEIPTSPSSIKHFALYPPELVKRILSAGCPKLVCPKCGIPQVKVYKNIDSKFCMDRQQTNPKGLELLKTGERDDIGGNFQTAETEYAELSDCGCGIEKVRGIAMDIFSGAGTSGIVAKKLDIDYIGVEINSQYNKIAKERIANTEKTLL